MIRIACTLALAVAVVSEPALAQRFGRIDARRPLDPDGSVRIFNLMGSVRIIGWDKDSIAVSGSVGQGGGRFYIGGDRRGVKLGIDLPVEDRYASGAELVVRVPARSRVRVKAASAMIDAESVTGGLDLNSVGGRIRVHGAPRELSAESMDGDIEISAAPEWLRAKSASGKISLHGGGNDVALSTVSGAIVIDGGSLDRARVESVTGDVTISARLERDGALDIDSHSGDVEIRLPPGAVAAFEVTTVSGQIENRLSNARPVAGREKRSQELNFSTGRGGRITVRSFKGTVTISGDTPAPKRKKA